MVAFAGGDIPPKKLQALQKVLQSEFCNAIREVSKCMSLILCCMLVTLMPIASFAALSFKVYEHVYETVDIQGNPEVRAQATAKVMSSVY